VLLLATPIAIIPHTHSLFTSMKIPLDFSRKVRREPYGRAIHEGTIDEADLARNSQEVPKAPFTAYRQVLNFDSAAEFDGFINTMLETAPTGQRTRKQKSVMLLGTTKQQLETTAWSSPDIVLLLVRDWTINKG